jgi:hypothetical protein
VGAPPVTAVETEAMLAGFSRGVSRRADVLLARGQPSQRLDDDRVFIYSWEVLRGVVLFPPSGAVPWTQTHCLAFRFDDRGVLADVALFQPGMFDSAPVQVRKWRERAAAEGREP